MAKKRVTPTVETPSPTIIRPDPENPVEYYNRGVELAKQGRNDDAIEQYRTADALWQKANSPHRKLALHNWATALFNLRRYEEAEAKYNEAIKADPQFAAAYNDLGRIFQEQGRYDDAIKQYQMSATLWTKTNAVEAKIALSNWANVLRVLKRYDEAEKKSEEAIAVDAQYAAAYNILGLALAGQQRHGDAIEQYRKADERFDKAKPTDRKFALRNWGTTLNNLRRYEEAEAKYKEAIKVDPQSADAYNDLGLSLAEQGRYDDAIKQYQAAATIWAKDKSVETKFALWNWGHALFELERFDDAVQKYKEATDKFPNAWGFFCCGNGFAGLGQYVGAIEQYDIASKMDPGLPVSLHNKAFYLFQLGSYKNGWKEWERARQCYLANIEKPEMKQIRNDSMLDALYFADVLRDIFADYEESQRIYELVIDKTRNNEIRAGAWCGLAILLQQWAESRGTPEVVARLSHTTTQATRALKDKIANVPNVEKFRTYLSLADLQIETRDWVEAKGSLDEADKLCESRLKRADVANRRGIVYLREENYAEALRNFRQALMVKPTDWTLHLNLAKVLKQSKQLGSAQEEFARILRSAPGHIDALLGAAQVCIELADDGDHDQYASAERHLSDSIEHGRNHRSGSRRLGDSEIANIFYLRGYVRVKQYESDASAARTSMLRHALKDFKAAKTFKPKVDKNNPIVASLQGHPKASIAYAKISKRLTQLRRESLLERIGPWFIFSAAMSAFLLAQADLLYLQFLFDELSYISLTLGAIVLMIAGLYLPNVSKLKVAGFELEKTSVDRLSLPSTLDIGPLTRELSSGASGRAGP